MHIERTRERKKERGRMSLNQITIDCVNE